MRYKIKTFTVTIKEDSFNQKMSNSECVVEFAKTIYQQLDSDQEHMTVFFLNNSNKINGYKTLFSGGQTQTITDKKIIFRNALLFGATNIIIIHNHPGGSLKPSREDIQFTQECKGAGKLLEIRLLDHIILASGNYYSMADEGDI